MDIPVTCTCVTCRQARRIEAEWRYALFWRLRWSEMANDVWVGCGEVAN